MAHNKRILNELNNMIPKKLVVLDLVDKFRFVQLDTQIIPSEIGVINTKTNSVEFKINVAPDYPFKPPSCYVNYNYNCYNYNNSNYYNDICDDFNTQLRLNSVVDRFQKYDMWAGSIIYRPGASRLNVRFNIECNLFNAWVFSIIRRPSLYRYWFGIIPDNQTCLCCESIVCYNKWCPAITMGDVLGEYVTRHDFKIYSGQLQQRRIKAIFDNGRWFIPEELVMKIIKIIVNVE